MDIAALIFIAVLVWYYGHSIKVASETDSHLKSTVVTELLGIKDALAQVARSISDLEGQLAKIDDLVHSADVEWKYFNDQKIDPILEKLDEIGTLSISTDSILGSLGSIETAVDSIAAHPSFAITVDDD